MDLENESTGVVGGGADVNERNGTDSDQHQLDCSGDPVEVEAVAVAEIQSSMTKKKKGHGLKTWRRIRRQDVGITKKAEMEKKDEKEKEKEKEKDYDFDSTTGRMLKRGSANIVNENDVSSSSSSMSATPKNHTAFNVGADSDNSEDSHGHRSSSKSSTAASHPKLPLRASSSSSGPRSRVNNNHKPIPTNTIDPIKKPRETSPLSSMESDSRSSNSFFFPTPISDSRQQHQQQQQQQQLPPPNLALSDQSADPLVHSILLLQSAQLALETEVQKFGEIGKDICSLCDDFDKTSGIPVPLVSDDPVVCMENASDGWSEFNHAYLSKIVQTLERQLNEAKGSLKEKELRIAELEITIRSTESPQDCARSTMEQQYKIEMEAELQDLIKEKLEGEVKSVVIARYSRDLSVLVEDQIKLSRERSSLSKEQAQSTRMTVNVENKGIMLQGQAEKSDTLYEEEIQKMQRRVVKFTKCLMIQLVLLVLVFALLFLPLVPKSAVVVPT